MIRVAMPMMLALVLMAGSADARRFRFFGFGGGGGGAAETITRVKDLPDRAPYLRDGVSWDVGYLDSMTKKDGYVLYHGDSYITLDEDAITLLTAELGSDPTAEHRRAAGAARKAAVSTSENSIERLPGESNEALAARARRIAADRGAGASAAAPSAGGGSSGRMLLALLIGGIGIFVVLKLAKAAFKPKPPEDAAEVEPASVDTASFDERVARRMAELQGGGAEPNVAAAAAAPAGVRTFGRRAA